MSSAATAVQVSGGTLMARPTAIYSPSSPSAHSHSPTHSVDSPAAAPNDKPLDFSKSSSASKTPPTSEEEDASVVAAAAMSSSSSSRGSLIDQIALTKSLAAATSAFFPQQPKYLKRDHCFSTPSPSPPERTHNQHFGLSGMAGTGAAAPVSPLPPTAASPEDAAQQMFGLLSQMAAVNSLNSQNGGGGMLNPLAAAAAANGAFANAALFKQLAGNAAAVASNQQAALLSALMQTAQNGTPNLELLKSLNAVPVSAPGPIQMSQPSPKMMASPVVSSHPNFYMQGGGVGGAPITSMAASAMSPTSALGLLSPAGAGGSHGAHLYAQHAAHSAAYPSVSSAEMQFTHSSPGALVDSTSGVYRASSGLRTSPPTSSNSTAKYTRPFKALYNSKDSFHAQSPFTPQVMSGLPANVSAAAPHLAPHDPLSAPNILLSGSDAAYQEFRNKMLLSKSPRAPSSSGGSQGSASGQPNGLQVKMKNDSHHSHHSDDSHSVASSNSLDQIEHMEQQQTQAQQQQQQQLAFFSGALSLPSSTTTMTTTSTSNGNIPATPVSASSLASPLTPPNYPERNGGGSVSSNSGRKRGRAMPNELKDDAYWSRRRKNNEAAKRSRDLRRAKEDEIAIRAAFLEQENFKLKCELVQMRLDNDKMRTLWLSTQQGQAMAASQLSPSALATADQATLAAMMQMQKPSPK